MLQILPPLLVRPELLGTAALELQADQSLAPSSQPSPTTPVSSDSSSIASCQEIAAALNISSAAGRLRRESQRQSDQVSEPGLVSVLSQHNTRNLEKLVLLDTAEQTTPVRSFSLNQFRNILRSDYRSTVIRPVATSTPSSSPPRNSLVTGLVCEQVSVIVTPSEVSSVGGDVFFTEEDLSDHLEPVVHIERVHFDPEEPADIMEQVIKDVKEGQRLLRVLKRTFTVNDLNEISLKSRLPAHMEKLEKLSEETMLKFDELTEDYGDELGSERKTEVVNAMAAFEHDVRTYRSGLEARFAQLQAVSQQAGAGGHGGELNSSRDQSAFQEEQLRVLREQLEQSKRETTSKEAILVREALEAKTIAIAKLKLKAKSVLEDAKDLSDLINKVGIESWSEQDDWLVIQTRRELKSWEEKLKGITAMHREAMELMAENLILDGAVIASNKVEDLILDYKKVSDAVIEEDLCRELHTMNTTVTEKVKYPSFGGTDEECYQDFKELLDKAFKHNQVSKSAKVAKLKECLKGNAKTIIPESMKDIDLAYSTLEKAFGDPTTHSSSWGTAQSRMVRVALRLLLTGT